MDIKHLSLNEQMLLGDEIESYTNNIIMCSDLYNNPKFSKIWIDFYYPTKGVNLIVFLWLRDKGLYYDLE